MDDYAAELRKLPQVDRIISTLTDRVPEAGTIPHAIAADAARAAIEEARAAIASGSKAPSDEQLVARARLLLRAAGRRGLIRVINATGVLLHTNLGRAPLGRDSLNAIETLSSGYSNLEYDLEKGSRGSRYDRAASLLTVLTGAEAALVVNNNAAAVLLALGVLARGREVIISRGELIEIGGGFRIPEILGESGAILREVGTTNRTHLRDYERALTNDTAAIMKVHPSNYRVLGFATSVPAPDLARLAHEKGLPLIHDLGSGLLKRRVGGTEPLWLAEEPSVVDALADDADVVTFSGDKLLGGPQAGIILGRAHIVERMHRSPLLRAFRVDKMTLAAMEATLNAYLTGRETELPLWRMALTAASEIEDRATRIREALGDVAAKVDTVDGFSTTGGGSLPGGEIATVLLEIAPRNISPDGLVRSLIDGDPPVIARIDEDRVVVDLRTVDPNDDETIVSALSAHLE